MVVFCLKYHNMLNFHRITCVDCPHFSDLYKLYAQAFPHEERRTWEGLVQELNSEKRFCAHALVQNNKFVGLFNYWTFDRFYYIEHIAVIESMRNQKLGTEAVEILKSQAIMPIVFEVELPTNSTAISRIRFYEKMGFSVVSHKYAQPPYDGEGFLIPMQLMTNNLHFAHQHFELIKETLYENVYHYTPNP